MQAILKVITVWAFLVAFGASGSILKKETGHPEGAKLIAPTIAHGAVETSSVDHSSKLPTSSDSTVHSIASAHTSKAPSSPIAQGAAQSSSAGHTSKPSFSNDKVHSVDSAHTSEAPASTNHAVEPTSNSTAISVVPNLTGSAKLIFNSIFNASALNGLMHETLSSNNSPQQQVCVDQYAVQNFVTLTVGGLKVRFCVRTTDWLMEKYFLTHSAAVFNTFFSEEMEKCAKNTNATLDCYANTICYAFTEITNFPSTCTHDDPCFQTALKSMIDEMDTNASELAQCLKTQSDLICKKITGNTIVLNSNSTVIVNSNSSDTIVCTKRTEVHQEPTEVKTSVQ